VFLAALHNEKVDYGGGFVSIPRERPAHVDVAAFRRQSDALVEPSGHLTSLSRLVSVASREL
jgi:hypothetical protein